ncbi:Dabb family protein [Litchfieldia alkalitelluris]|uniref:Dabb family protein n=1 Tax=Litchfieldia alkalitelluris TaxID=304268 RepID=UPI0009988319|nr:Dabb family protein [Litchfieldia alkalitelluris]
MYEHMVFFKFNEHFTTVKGEELIGLLKQFKEAIPGIVELTAGINVTDEKENEKGYKLGLRVTFENKDALDNYGPHPIHQKFVRSLDGVIADVIVVDYPNPT